MIAPVGGAFELVDARLARGALRALRVLELPVELGSDAG